jgi:hypothetical protein
MKRLLALIRFDVIVQARNGFYWASGFVVLAVSALLAALPEGMAFSDRPSEGQSLTHPRFTDLQAAFDQDLSAKARS